MASSVELIDDASKGDSELPTLHALAQLKDVDDLVAKQILTDRETIAFLVQNRVARLWDAVMNQPGFDVEALRTESGGAYFETIARTFLEQYDAARAQPLPEGYDFRINGELILPNLMQRLVAWRVLTERRLGNWSGVGAGKTLSAILASRVVNARFSLIIAFNSNIEEFASVITNAFPAAQVITRERGELNLDPSRPAYLLLNYEAFQQPDAEEMAERLVRDHPIDFVALDEAQMAKQRDPKSMSRRRAVVDGMLKAVSAKRPDLCVLPMSATPVLNNLTEGKTLLELTKGVEMPELKTTGTIQNALDLHVKLALHGVRYRPQYSQTIHRHPIPIRGEHLIDELLAVGKQDIAALEQILLKAKLPVIVENLRPATLLFTQYKTGMVKPLREAIQKAGFTVGEYTGDDKTGLKAFIDGDVDILIGTKPLATGVDGLQYRCNRLIGVSLPWTPAEFEQLIGRLYRQGSAFSHVDVLIPQVELVHEGQRWNWDEMRMARLTYKKTLADCAVDGVVPEGKLASEMVLLQKAREALRLWIQRLES